MAPPERSTLIAVKVVPGASRSRIMGWLGTDLKVQVAAAPEKGRANEAVCRIVAEALGLKPQAVSVVAGHAQPRKKLAIRGLDQNQVQERLAVVG